MLDAEVEGEAAKGSDRRRRPSPGILSLAIEDSTPRLDLGQVGPFPSDIYGGPHDREGRRDVGDHGLNEPGSRTSSSDRGPTCSP